MSRETLCKIFAVPPPTIEEILAQEKLQKTISTQPGTKETCSSLKRKIDHGSMIEQESRSGSSKKNINPHVTKKQKGNPKELVDLQTAFNKRKELESSSDSTQPIVKKLKVTKPHPITTTAPRIPERISIPIHSSTVNKGPKAPLKKINVTPSKNPPNTTALTTPSAKAPKRFFSTVATEKDEITSLSDTTSETSLSSSSSSPSVSPTNTVASNDFRSIDNILAIVKSNTTASTASTPASAPMSPRTSLVRISPTPAKVNITSPILDKTQSVDASGKTTPLKKNKKTQAATRYHRDRSKETEELDFDTLLKRREEASAKAQNKNKASPSKPTTAISSKSPVSAKKYNQVKLKRSSSAGPSTTNILKELLQIMNPTSKEVKLKQNSSAEGSSTTIPKELYPRKNFTGKEVDITQNNQVNSNRISSAAGSTSAIPKELLQRRNSVIKKYTPSIYMKKRPPFKELFF